MEVPVSKLSEPLTGLQRASLGCPTSLLLGSMYSKVQVVVYNASIDPEAPKMLSSLETFGQATVPPTTHQATAAQKPCLEVLIADVQSRGDGDGRRRGSRDRGRDPPTATGRSEAGSTATGRGVCGNG